MKVTWLESGKVSLHTEGMGPQSLRAYFPHGDTCSRQMFVESLHWFGAIFGAKNKVNRDIAMGSLKCNVWNIGMRSYKKFHGIPEEWQHVAGSGCMFKLTVTYRMGTYGFYSMLHTVAPGVLVKLFFFNVSL